MSCYIFSVFPLSLSAQAKSNVSQCFPVFLYARHYYSSQSKATKGSNSTYENYKTLIKSLLFQNLFPNLDIMYVYILFNSVYVYIYTNHGKLDNILGFR